LPASSDCTLEQATQYAFGGDRQTKKPGDEPGFSYFRAFSSFSAKGILQSADCALNLTGGLVGGAVGSKLRITRQLASDLFCGAFCLFGCAFDAILVHLLSFY
jgi:hypothetical protein